VAPRQACAERDLALRSGLSMMRRTVERRAPSPWDGRFAFAYALLLAALVTGVCVVFALPHGAPRCDEALVPMPVPASWERSVELPEMAGFRLVRGEPPDTEEFVVEDGVCPGEGAPLHVRLLGYEPSAASLRVRRMYDWDTFVLVSAGPWRVTAKDRAWPPRSPYPISTDVDPPEKALVAFRAVSRLPFAIPPKVTVQVAGLCLAAGVAIVWGIVRARRRLRLARDLLDPERFVEATCTADGTLWIGDSAVVVRGEPVGTRRPGRVVVRVAGESGGDYRTPPTAQVADVFQGDRRQAANRQVHRASIILSAFTAVTISIAIVAGALSVDTWVSQEEAQRAAFHHRKELRQAR
jgi:hypothetical protein